MCQLGVFRGHEQIRGSGEESHPLYSWLVRKDPASGALHFRAGAPDCFRPRISYLSIFVLN